MASLNKPPLVFAELLAKTAYSFLEGASQAEEMVGAAARLGYSALGVVDRGGLYGAPFAHQAAKAGNLKLIHGAEVCFFKDKRAFLLAKTRKGYGDLCELLTEGHKRRGNISQKERLGSFDIEWERFLEMRADLFLVLPSWEWQPLDLDRIGRAPKDTFLSISLFADGKDGEKINRAEHLSARFKLPLIVSNQPLFHAPEKKRLHDVLSCAKHNVTLRAAGFRLVPNAERCLKPIPELYRRFVGKEAWLRRTVEIAEACTFSLEELTYHYPREWIPAPYSAESYLEHLVAAGVQERYGAAGDTGFTGKVLAQVEHELCLIRDLKYADYFLTVWDIVRFARSQRILCQGRGSAANSVVCYVLGITAIDPVRMSLLFERFISRERNEPPDIDIDFEHERREEVIQYIYQRYGRHRAAITAEFICYRRRSAVREAAKAYEISLPTVEKILAEGKGKPLASLGNYASPSHNGHPRQSEPPRHCERPCHCERSEAVSSLEQELTQNFGPQAQSQLFFQTVSDLRGLPRHVGTHVGGFVLCEEPLSRNVPIEGAAMKDRTIVQWDKNGLDALGFVRVDILGLGILTAIRKSFEILEVVYGKKYELSTVPREDPKVYEMISRGDTVGVFQIESRAQMNMLPRLRPKNFFDLVVEISLVRPGPIQGDMVHPYLRRRAGKEPVEYAHPDLKEILGKTYGVPLFQEQIMKMAMKVAGFTAGEADELRRAMGSWRREGGNRLTKMGHRFCEGLMQKGIHKEFADRIFKQIEGFAEYGFPESHAASFAILAYVTSWLKCYYPDVFLAALLNSQPMGFYSSRTLIYDAERHGVKTRGIDVNHSRWDNTLEAPGEVRLGFREIRGLPKVVAQALESARRERPFTCLQELAQRLPKCTKRDLFFLAGADAFGSLKTSRREALWEIQALSLKESPYFSPEGQEALLPEETKWERVLSDMEAQSVSLFAHPMALLREYLLEQGVISSNQLANNFNKLKNKKITVAGMVVSRQMPPTASGVLFITLEDEFGFMNLVVWNTVFEKYRYPLITRSFLLVEGRLQKAEDGHVLHVIVDKAESFLEGAKIPSRDFR